MNRTLSTLAATLLLSLFAGAGAGCLYAAAAAAGAGAYAYVQGESQANVDGSVSKVVGAAEEALKSLDMIVLSSESSDLEGEVKAETRDAKDVRIRVERLTDTSSKLKIRVGTFGDKDVGRAIYDRIVERL